MAENQENQVSYTLTPIWRKSEFWVSLVTNITGILMAFGVVSTEQKDAITSCIPQVVGGVVALLSAFKFINVQQAAKAEAFKAMCAMRLSSQQPRQAPSALAAQALAVQEDVCGIAKTVGL